jgi:tetratricopeptide (TPR) repeat protein
MTKTDENQNNKNTRKKLRPRPSDDMSPPRSSSSTIPYLISPRQTYILNGNPTLRWNSIPGAMRYQVEVSGNGEPWTVEVRETQVEYAGEPLQPGYRYQVTVTADNGTSTQSENDVGFTILGGEEAQGVRTELARLERPPLTEETAFEWVDVYSPHGLYADAIEVLEEQIRNGNQTLDVYGALGDLHRWVGLNALAVEWYEKALELATGKTEQVQELQKQIDDLR